MKKSLLVLFTFLSSASFAQTVSYIGTPQLAANGNWFIDGYKYDGKSVDCKSVASANADIRDERQSTKGYDIVEKKCGAGFDPENPKQCLITGTVKKTKYGVEFSKITKAEITTIPVNCE